MQSTIRVELDFWGEPHPPTFISQSFFIKGAECTVESTTIFNLSRKHKEKSTDRKMNNCFAITVLMTIAVGFSAPLVKRGASTSPLESLLRGLDVAENVIVSINLFNMLNMSFHTFFVLIEQNYLEPVKRR